MAARSEGALSSEGLLRVKPGFSPRPACIDDVPQVAEIEARSIRPPWSEESFAAEIGKSHAHFWVVTDDETDSNVLAYVVFSFPAEQAHIQTIAVHPEQRRRGIGEFLIRRMISFVMRKGGDSIVLEVRKRNEAAIRLYQRLGFVVVRSMKGFYPDGEDGFAMIYKTEPTRIQGSNEDDPGAESDRRKQNFN